MNVAITITKNVSEYESIAGIGGAGLTFKSGIATSMISDLAQPRLISE